MNNQPLPNELARQWANLPDLSYRGGGEWSSACPRCGGSGRRHDKSDRFRLFEAGDGKGARAWCRQCQFFAWADQDEQRPSQEAIEAATKERLRLLEIEHRRIKDKLQRIADSDFWRRWHDTMSDGQRDLWHKEGIIDWAIEEYKLGFCADHTTYHDGLEWHTPTLTIPHWGKGWELVNIQHRLLNPPEPGDKYRQTAGLPAAMFLTEPDRDIAGPVLIVEGAKKAIVTLMHVGGKDLMVVGLPGKSPSGEMLDQLQQCEPVYLALDPDAYVPTRAKDGRVVEPAVKRLGSKLDGRARFVRLPAKPDDLFKSGVLTASKFGRYLAQATKAL